MPDSPWVIDVSDQCDRIESLLQRSHDLPVFFVFYATWCTPPQRLELVLNPMAEKAQGRYLMVNVDVDRCLEFARQYAEYVVPSAVAFQNGYRVARHAGMGTNISIQDFIDAGCQPNAPPLVFDTRSLWQQIKDYFRSHPEGMCADKRGVSVFRSLLDSTLVTADKELVGGFATKCDLTIASTDDEGSRMGMVLDHLAMAPNLESGLAQVTEELRSLIQNPLENKPGFDFQIDQPYRRFGLQRAIRLGDRITMGIALWKFEELVDPIDQPIGDGVLQVLRLLMHLIPSEAQRLREEELNQAMPAKNTQGESFAGVGETDSFVRLIICETGIRERPEHARHSPWRYAEPAR